MLAAAISGSVNAQSILEVRVNQASDDMEEVIEAETILGQTRTEKLGSMDSGSSDLELGAESSNNRNPQMVGVRFASINLPKGTIINKAYIQFTVDNTSKNTDPCVQTIYAEDNVNPLTFENDSANITSRLKLSTVIPWNVSGDSWNTVGSNGTEQQSADIKDLVQALIDKTEWKQGNPMAFFFKGTGLREVESFEGSANNAPLLVIDYTYNGCIGNVTSEYPIDTKQSWSNDYSGNTPDLNWKALDYNDTCWTNSAGAFGYNVANLNSELDFGSDANNKPITAYFRKRFNVTDLNSLGSELEMNVRVNDGYVVYVNGTEVKRFNMPSGTISNNTLASKALPNSEAAIYFTSKISTTSFVSGDNIISVEVHQASASSSDLVFDLQLKETSGDVLADGYGCNLVGSTHISCFTSVAPKAQDDTTHIPSETHAFQFLYTQGDTYTDGGGTVPGNFDFTGYVGIEGSSKLGYLSVNHENSPGGVSMCEIHFDDLTGLWVLDSAKKVDFGGDLVRTVRNCSGGVTPWGTIITSEESTTNTDENNDGYHDVGWQVEIDPATARVKEYGNGKREKLWKMGKMSHENIVIADDSKTAYFGEDASTGKLWKFVANTPEDMSEGTLYVLKLDQPLIGGEPQSTTGTWVEIDNSTPTLCNNVNSTAAGLGATEFNGIEDAEISPLDGKIYFTAKGTNRVYCFADAGSTVTNFITFVGGDNNYLINSGDGKVVSEPWGSGNDNLTFDDKGNLYMLQDGSRNHVWMIYPEHTQASPKVEIFMVTPIGSEPTGMTFSPDYKYIFISIQHPNGNVPQTDIAGVTQDYANDAVLVVARKEFLGKQQPLSSNEIKVELNGLVAFPNPFNTVLNLTIDSKSNELAQIALVDLNGKVVLIDSINLIEGENQHILNTENLSEGIYFVTVTTGNTVKTIKVVLSK